MTISVIFRSSPDIHHRHKWGPGGPTHPHSPDRSPPTAIAKIRARSLVAVVYVWAGPRVCAVSPGSLLFSGLRSWLRGCAGPPGHLLWRWRMSVRAAVSPWSLLLRLIGIGWGLRGCAGAAAPFVAVADVWRGRLCARSRPDLWYCGR